MRNKIYNFTLSGNTWHIAADGELTSRDSQTSRNDYSALLRVCRYINEEARLLPWSLGSF
jgi:hypothetical protein